MSSPFVPSPNASWAYAAISLMGHERVVGKVCSCAAGGFYVQPCGGSEFDGDLFYLGPCAIFTMHDITEAQALATVRSMAESATTRLPGWVIAEAPPARPAVPAKFVPPPLRDSMRGDQIAIDDDDIDLMTTIEAVGRTYVFLADGRRLLRVDWLTRVTAYAEYVPF